MTNADGREIGVTLGRFEGADINGPKKGWAVFLHAGTTGRCLGEFPTKAAGLPLFRHIRDDLRYFYMGDHLHNFVDKSVREFKAKYPGSLTRPRRAGTIDVCPARLDTT